MSSSINTNKCIRSYLKSSYAYNAELRAARRVTKRKGCRNICPLGQRSTRTAVMRISIRSKQDLQLPYSLNSHGGGMHRTYSHVCSNGRYNVICKLLYRAGARAAVRFVRSPNLCDDSGAGTGRGRSPTSGSYPETRSPRSVPFRSIAAFGPSSACECAELPFPIRS